MRTRVPQRASLGAVAVLVAALVGCAPAGAASAQRFQAERMHVAKATGRVVHDASASGRRALLLVGAGSAQAQVPVRAASRLTVLVRGRSCAGAPRLTVAVDGATVLARRVVGAFA
jgi:hypothetical protein